MFRVSCFVFRVSCFVFRVSCLAFRVSCFDFDLYVPLAQSAEHRAASAEVASSSLAGHFSEADAPVAQLADAADLRSAILQVQPLPGARIYQSPFLRRQPPRVPGRPCNARR